ncbi:MAG: sugar phosphate nucleotidyltransferase [Candidatus Micrarchaeia archaeon]
MPEKLTGLILAGGLGTRMRPFTLHTPKNLIEISGRAFLDYQLELFAANGVSRVVLSTGYLGHKIEDWLGSHSTHGIKVEVCHEKELLGTGGAIINSLGAMPDEFFLTYGDSYLLQPFADVFSAFKKSGKPAMMTVLGQSSGTAENNCSIKDGQVVRYAKKQPAGTFSHMDYGLLFFKKPALSGYKLENFSTDRIFADLIAKGHLAAFVTRVAYYEVGSKEGLRNFTSYIQNLGRE